MVPRGLSTQHNPRVLCARVASPLGSNNLSWYHGDRSRPWRSSQARSSPGQAGCLRGGLYEQNVKITRGGTRRRPDHDHELSGRARDTARAASMWRRGEPRRRSSNSTLDGRNSDDLPSPTVNGDDVAFRDNDVTNGHTRSPSPRLARIGPAQRTVIERNRIHDCGELPPTNHDHGIYVESSDGLGSPTTGSTTTPIAESSSSPTRRRPRSRQRDPRQRTGRGLLARVREQRGRAQRDHQPAGPLQPRGLPAPPAMETSPG